MPTFLHWLVGAQGALFSVKSYNIVAHVAQMPTNISKLKRRISSAEHLLLRFARVWLPACSVSGEKGSCSLLETSVINEVLSFLTSLHWLYRELGSDSRWSESLHSYECGLLRGRSNIASGDIGILVNLKESYALKPLQLYLYKSISTWGYSGKVKINQTEVWS